MFLIPTHIKGDNKMEYAPDYRPVIVNAFSPMNFREHPNGLHPDWYNRQTAPQYLDEVFARFSRTNRGMLYMPAGRVGGWYAAAQWYTMEPWRRELLIDRTNEWLSGNPNRTVELFIGCRPPTSVYHLAPGPYNCDPGHQPALSRFVANVLPWVSNLHLHRLWLDHASTNFNWPHVKNMAMWCKQNWGLQLGAEAFRNVKVAPQEWELIQEDMEEMPMFCLSTFAQTRDADEEWGSIGEAIVCLRNIDNPTEEWVDGLRERGFIVGSMSPTTDHLVG